MNISYFKWFCLTFSGGSRNRLTLALILPNAELACLQ